MDFRDVPNLLKFQQFAREHTDCEITMATYRKVRELIADAPQPPQVLNFGAPDAGAPIADLKASCAAIEKATRVLWACATATDRVEPPLWEYTPDFDSAVEYFLDLDDLELMSVTRKHRITWEDGKAAH